MDMVQTYLYEMHICHVIYEQSVFQVILLNSFFDKRHPLIIYAFETKSNSDLIMGKVERYNEEVINSASLGFVQLIVLA